MPVLWKALVSSSVGNTEASFLETTRKQIDRFMGSRAMHEVSCAEVDNMTVVDNTAVG